MGSDFLGGRCRTWVVVTSLIVIGRNGFGLPGRSVPSVGRCDLSNRHRTKWVRTCLGTCERTELPNSETRRVRRRRDRANVKHTSHFVMGKSAPGRNARERGGRSRSRREVGIAPRCYPQVNRSTVSSRGRTSPRPWPGHPCAECRSRESAFPATFWVARYERPSSPSYARHLNVSTTSFSGDARLATDRTAFHSDGSKITSQSRSGPPRPGDRQTEVAPSGPADNPLKQSSIQMTSCALTKMPTHQAEKRTPFAGLRERCF